MKKLKLNLDQLAVDTFTTDHHQGGRGTVAGHATNLCITYRCQNTNLCTGGDSCDGTCYATCGDVNCASYELTNCGGTAYDASCAGGDCYNTDNENTCLHTCLNSCDNVQTCKYGC
jgi:hypothetical protein